MKKTPACLVLVLAAAACSEAKTTPAPSPAPANEPAVAPAKAPVTEAPKEPAAPPTAAAPLKLVKTTPSANYPLKTCVVSGEELPALEQRRAYMWGETEVQFCCPDCIADFEKDPEKYLAMIRAAK